MEDGIEALTVYRKANEQKHSGLQRNDVHEKMTLIVCPNATVDPGAMALGHQYVAFNDFKRLTGHVSPRNDHIFCSAYS